jgi:heptosyltransferase-1
LKVLIVKLSSLGDVVHAMPAVQDIMRAVPGVQIDWVVERGFLPLVRRCKGVHRIIASDLRQWRKQPFKAATRQAWHLFKVELQQERYDAVIDLQGLTKSALVSGMARLSEGGKRYGLANQTEGSSFEAPARWVADVAVTLPAHIHAVTRSRELCAKALAYGLPLPMEFGLVPLVDKAPADIKTIAFRRGLRGMVALVHGTSRADKQWPVAYWCELARQLNDAGFGVVLPHGNPAEEQVSRTIAHDLEHAQVWPAMALDALTDALGTCFGAIGVDSGLSHMAVALDLRHVQIYNFDTAWRTGPLPPALADQVPHQCSVFAQPTPSVDAVWQAWLDVLSA